MPSRTHSTDLMRIIAAFFVVLLHCSDLGSTAGLVFNALSRFSVPVFVMISGYHILDTPVNLVKTGKKAFKMFGLLIVWSVIFYSYSILVGRLTYTGLRDIVTYLLTGPIHLWYLYAAIALYLMAPLLQVFHQHATKSTYCYGLILLCLVGSVVKTMITSNVFPLLETMAGSMKLPTTVGFVALFLAGGFFKKYHPLFRQRTLLYILGILGTIGTIFATWNLRNTAYSQLFLSFFSPTVILSALGFFLYMKRKFQDYKPGHPKFLRCLSKATLGIYLVHPLFNMALQDLQWPPFSQLPRCISIIFTAILIFLLSLTVTLLYQWVHAILLSSKESL